MSSRQTWQKSGLANKDDERESLRAQLHDRLESLVSSLEGDGPTRRHGRQWRWRESESLVVDVAGPKRGRWSDWRDNKHGDVFALIQHLRGCGFREALEYARRFVGSVAPEPQRRAAKPEPSDEQRARDARTAFHVATPFVGTIGETYLRETRKIAPEGPWPCGLRFDPKTRALIAPLTLRNGTINAVHRIYILAPPDFQVLRKVGAFARRKPDRFKGQFPLLIRDSYPVGLVVIRHLQLLALVV